VTKRNDVKEKILSVTDKADVILLVPPFATTRTPVMGPYILQSIARQAGFKAEVLCLNQLLASIIGIELYESISFGQPFRMLGERLFARSAYGLPPLGNSAELCFNPAGSVFGNEQPANEFEYKYYDVADFELESFLEIEKVCNAFIEEVSHAIAALEYKILLCSVSWEQNNCCVSLINKIKELQPNILTLVGGSNCEAKMAEAIASLSDSIDYVFSGESEHSFRVFLTEYSRGRLPADRIITGEPVEDLDKIPLPDYRSYFRQMACFFEGKNPPKGITMSYEASRGCDWGKCYFCGMNGKRTRFRQKDAAKVVRELEQISTHHPDYQILFIDKMLPVPFLKRLLPMLQGKPNISSMTCEIRPDLKLQELIRLKQANINIIKPGIEALSTGLLKSIGKGVTARQNILLLRNAASLDMHVSWNLLWGFPNDKAVYYEEILKVIPLIHHLTPPMVFRHISLDRFCSYFNNPGKYRIKNLRPWAAYQTVYPDYIDVSKLAYRFIGDYSSQAHDRPGLIREIAKEVDHWKKSWSESCLRMAEFAGTYIVHDNRRIAGKNKNHVLDSAKAIEIMTYDLYKETENQKWAIEENLGMVIDSRYVPLVIASRELLLRFDAERKLNRIAA
jgi:ribosomal peptide maturation radical SAM protein 1